MEGPYIEPSPPRHLIERLKERFPGAVPEVTEFRGEITAVVPGSGILEICRYLKDEPGAGFDMLTVVTGLHYLDRDYDYEVLYHLYSTANNHRLRLKVRLKETETVDSVTPLWSGANWLEREVYDLVGVRFHGHPDLRRIIMPEDYPYHPLRKDFDVEGVPSETRTPGLVASPGFRDMESV